jgi:hypothetical protein
MLKKQHKLFAYSVYTAYLIKNIFSSTAYLFTANRKNFKSAITHYLSFDFKITK